MFLRSNRRFKDGKEHHYWNIVENRRCASGKVVQRQVLYLGEIGDGQHDDWSRAIEAFDEDAQRHTQLSLFSADRELPGQAEGYGVQVRLDAMELHRPRQWGACWLSCELYEQLGLDQFWARRLRPSREGTNRCDILQTLVCYRLIDPGSEWRLHRQWFEQSAMADLLGADFMMAEKNALYRCLDKLLPHKQALFSHLRQRWADLFGAKFEVLLYDLTSTYFESAPPDDDNDKRRFGYSRDKRSDCVQVVIALIVTPDGFPLAYEVLPGNTADSTTLRGFLHKIETQYGKAQRIWVMDRGIPTDAVLAEMRQADPPVSYLVGTPKGRLSKLEKALLDKPWQAVREGVDVKVLPQDQETYVFAQSRARIHKERAMRRRKLKWLWSRLKQIANMKLTRKEFLMKLGAARSKARAAWRLIDIDIAPSGTAFSFTLNREKLRQVRRREGRYLLRTNLGDRDPADLWQFYIQLTEVQPERRSPAAADLSSGRASSRGAYLRRLPRLLPARHVAGATEAAGAGPHIKGGARQDGRGADARRALPDNRRTHADPQPLYGAQYRPEAAAQATQARFASAATATHHVLAEVRSPPSPSFVVETFDRPLLILLAFSLELRKLG